MSCDLLLLLLVLLLLLLLIIIIIIPVFAIGSIYSTNAGGAEQMPETNNSNQT